MELIHEWALEKCESRLRHDTTDGTNTTEAGKKGRTVTEKNKRESSTWRRSGWNHSSSQAWFESETWLKHRFVQLEALTGRHQLHCLNKAAIVGKNNTVFIWLVLISPSLTVLNNPSILQKTEHISSMPTLISTSYAVALQWKNKIKLLLLRGQCMVGLTEVNWAAGLTLIQDILTDGPRCILSQLCFIHKSLQSDTPLI